MPRKAREKNPEAVYHIICRSISELLLFRDDTDKDYYLSLLKRYTSKYECSLYSYCLMDNHVHLQLDPKGYDISAFMQSLNTAYVFYYNKKYQRHGHVFQGRFESRILNTNDYNLTVCAYIHNNPHDIKEFTNKEETYKYSSYGIYLGIRRDVYKLIDKSFIFGLFNIKSEIKFAKKFFEFVSHHRDLGTIRTANEKLSSAVEYDYISGRKVYIRNLSPIKVLSLISEKLMISDKLALLVKNYKRYIDFRAFSVYVLRVLCGLNYKAICDSFYNITISGCSNLCRKGHSLLLNGSPMYLAMFDDLLASAG